MESNHDFVGTERPLPAARLTFPPGLRRRRLWGGVVLGVVLGVFTGCGGRAGIDADAGDGGTIANGTKVWSSTATKLVAKILGDGFPPPPAPSPTAPCVRGWTYTLTMNDRKLSWYLCTDFAADPAMALKTGERVLSTAELAGVVSALDTVVVSHRAGCGPDRPTELLTITTPEGDRDVFDDFSDCNATPGRTYVAKIDSVIEALNALAK